MTIGLNLISLINLATIDNLAIITLFIRRKIINYRNTLPKSLKVSRTNSKLNIVISLIQKLLTLISALK